MIRRGILLVLFIAIASAKADIWNWTGDSASSSNWSDAANWESQTVPASGAGTILNFSFTNRLDPIQNLANPFVLNQINFLQTNASYTLSGQGIRFQGAGAGITTSTFAFDHTLRMPITIGDDVVTVSVNSLGALTLEKPVTGTGQGYLDKEGGGTLVLAAPLMLTPGATPGLIVGGGTLRLAASDLIDPQIQILVTGTFDLNGMNQTFQKLPYGALGSGKISLSGGNLTIGGIAGADAFNIHGIAGPGQIIKAAGFGKFDQPQPDFTGTVRVQNQGTINVTSNGSLGDAVGGTIIEAGGSLNLGVNYTMSEPLILRGLHPLTSALRATGPASFAGPITLEADSNIGTSGGSLTLTGGIDIGAFNAYFGESVGTITINSNGIRGAGGVRKVSQNPQTAEALIINAPSTYTGPTTIDRGAIEVNTTLETTRIDVLANGILRGNGTAASASLTVSGQLQPGINIGHFDAKFLVLNSGAKYIWQISDANAVPGVSSDILNLTQAISAPSTSGILIVLNSLTASNQPGPLANFDNTRSWQWPVITADSLASNVTPSDFSIDLGNFPSFNNLGGGNFGVILDGSTVAVRFNPLPEPHALLWLPALLMFRRRNKPL